MLLHLFSVRNLLLLIGLMLAHSAYSSPPQVGEKSGQRSALRLEGEDEKEETDEEVSESDEEFNEELEERLDEALELKRFANEKSAVFRQRALIAEQQVQLIRELMTIRKQVASVEAMLDRGRFRNPEQAEELEEDLARQESRMDEKFFQLEISDRKLELLGLREDYQELGDRQNNKQFDELERSVALASQRVGQMFRAFRNGNERQGEELGETLEEMREDFDERVEVLHLRLELHYAREEGLEEEVQELEEVLRSFGTSLEVEPSGKRAGGEGTAPVDLPAPILLSDQEIKATNKFDFETQIKPLLTQYCQDCHSGSEAASDLALDRLMLQTPFVVNRKHWKNITQQLRVRSMPPADAELPSDKERRLLVAWLQNEIENFDYESIRSPGREPTRRLTHEEYNNTIRDLLGVDLRPADQFPADLTASSGFHNSANSLFIQPITMERYLGAAEWVVNEAANKSKPAPTYSKLVGILGEQSPEAAIRHFASRAFRRPLEVEELKKLTQFFQDQAAANGEEKALQKTMEVVLVSPSFLMRSSQKPTDEEVGLVSDFELASRLSYFLWASMPDDQLFSLARDGKLQDPAVLKLQVERMLKDRRAQTLGTQFLAQWLGIVNLKRVPRDQIDNPWATDSLVAAMEAESALFFYSLIYDNATIDQFIDAKYTFLNEELAKHYEIRGIDGAHMRRVSLKGNPRGGVLGQGSVLTITSFPGRTSPVVRGNWILSELLGTPPPPPPPNVSEFNERLQERRLSQRQKLELHRQNPNCYSCHNEIDPLGFPLENFENFGQYRSRMRGRPIDTRGKLPSGREVDGISGLRKAILEERMNDLVDQMTRKLLAYAIGRQLDYYDEAAIREITGRFESEGRKMQSLIQLIVASDTFRKQGTPDSSLVTR